MQYNGSFPRDANHQVDTTNGCLSTDIQNLTGTGTVVVPIFGITGNVEARGLWGIVTTVLGNCTAAYWRLNDGTTQNNITLNTGTTISNAAAGSSIMKKAVAATALTVAGNTQQRVIESAANGAFFTSFIATQKLSTATNIEFVYTTTDNPITGTIQFFLRWVPLSADALVTSL